MFRICSEDARGIGGQWLSLAGLGAYILWAREPDNRGRRWGVVAAVMAVIYALEVAVVAGGPT